MRAPTPLLLSVGLLLSVAGACVPRAEHELIEVQLDATRMALNAGNASHYKEVEELEAQLAQSREALARVAQAQVDREERVEALEQELTVAREQLAALSQLQVDEDDARAPIVAAVNDRLTAALAAQAEAELQAQHRDRRHARWVQRFSALAEAGELTVLQRGPHTVVRIPTRKLLNEGRVSVSPRGEMLVKAVATQLKDTVGLDVLITAHTDDRPYHSTDFHSSWELGFGQSMALVRALQAEGVKAQLEAASAAGSRPLASNDTDEGRRLNQRLELTILPGPSPVTGGAVPEEPAESDDQPPAE
jgi:flagellar motor protein MotB